MLTAQGDGVREIARITTDFTNFYASQFPGFDLFLVKPENFGFRPIHPESNMYVRVD